MSLVLFTVLEFLFVLFVILAVLSIVVFVIAIVTGSKISTNDDVDSVIKIFRELPESWQKRIAEDARKTREKYERK